VTTLSGSFHDGKNLDSNLSTPTSNKGRKKIGRPQTYHILGQVYYFMMKYTAEKEKKLLNPKLTVMINHLNYAYPTLVFIKITHLKDFLF
jgi:hypothetical protein